MLLDRFKEKQGNLSDYVFAKVLGVSQQMWQATRTGKKPIGLTVIKGAAPLYPEFALDVLDFFGFDVNKVIAILNNVTTTPQTAPSQNPGGFGASVKGFFRSCFRRS